MKMSTVSTKGQVTIPVDIRKDLGLKPHDRVSFVKINGNTVIRRVKSLYELKGFAGKALPIEEEERLMEEAVARHVMGLDD
jgi:antitoxin PrlF